MSKLQYLGDGAYAEITAQGIVLTTSNGIENTNRIVLEPEVWGTLVDYVASYRVSEGETGSADK